LYIVRAAHPRNQVKHKLRHSAAHKLIAAHLQKKNKKQKKKNRQSPQELSSYIFGLYVPAWTQLVRWTDTWTSQADWFGVVRSAGLGRLADYSFIDRLVKIHESMKKHRAFFGVLQ